MTLLEEAVLEMTDLLEQLGLDYMLIGGMAVALWGNPRVTLDVDLTLWVEPDRFESTVEELAAKLPLRTAQPLETARRLRVLPVRASNGVPVDLLFAAWPVEKGAIQRAAGRQVGSSLIRVAPLDYLLFRTDFRTAEGSG